MDLVRLDADGDSIAGSENDQLTLVNRAETPVVEQHTPMHPRPREAQRVITMISSLVTPLAGGGVGNDGNIRRSGYIIVTINRTWGLSGSQMMRPAGPSMT
ncbi:hypothetical protein [Mycobacterium lepromatosis]|nr:hypothetical protein [Mycobacterium lepromatosis]